MEWLATHLPRATLCALDDVGHFLFIEAAERFTQQVAVFVTRT
jgi:pimeloyl-ACP methyl ester carboxylesterase